MAAKRSQQNAATDAEKQKRTDEDARIRIKCLEIASSVQTIRTNAMTIIQASDKIFGYVKTGKMPE